MRKKLLLLYLLTVAFFSNAQNVGINTTTPQATLDVRGSQRTGGINNYINYDSATGKIEWVGASLWTPVSQQIIKHSASSEGLYAGGGKLEYRNSTGAPVFYSDWTNGNGYFSGNLGIGAISPTVKLQVRDGASGMTPYFTARMAIESNNHTYINLLSPDPFATGILFGSGTNAADGVISYNSGSISKGFLFSTNGSQPRMVIVNVGNVGIGTLTPQKNLSVERGMNIDQADGNIGSAAINAITFGNSSGEGIGSKRNAGGNQWGLDFYTNSTNKMSITNSGNIGIGTTNPAAKLQVSAGDASFVLFGPNSYNAMLYVGASPNNQSAALTAQIIASDGNLHIDPAAGKNIYIGYFQPRDIYLNPNGGNVGIGTTTPGFLLEVNGSAGKVGGGSWSVTSDARMKKNVMPYTDGLSTILKINPVKYHYNQLSGYDTNPEYVGVLAQDIKLIAPYMIGSFQKKGETYYNVDNSAMTYMLINAVKEQQLLIDKQQWQIDELKKMMEKLLKQ